jgi:hypothetical protein
MARDRRHWTATVCVRRVAGDLAILASETGVLPIRPEEVRAKGRLQPGRMFLVDTEQGRLVPDEEIKQALAARQPYGDWIRAHQMTLDKLPSPPRWHATELESIVQRNGRSVTRSKTQAHPAPIRAMAERRPMARTRVGVPAGPAAALFHFAAGRR